MAIDPKKMIGDWELEFRFGGKVYSHEMKVNRLLPENAGAPDPVSGVLMPFSFFAYGWWKKKPAYKWLISGGASMYGSVDFWVRYTAQASFYGVHCWGQMPPGFTNFRMKGKAVSNTYPGQSSTEDLPGRIGTWEAWKKS